MKNIKIWSCKVIVEGDNCKDNIPRFAVITALENEGFEILTTFSGWCSSELTSSEKEVVKHYYLKNRVEKLLNELDKGNKLVNVNKVMNFINDLDS